jgi:hypothetical protein
VSGGAATVEQTAFGQQNRPHAHPTKSRASRVLLANPLNKRRRCLTFGKAANRGRDQQRYQCAVNSGMTVVNALGRMLRISLPVADSQQRQLRALMLGGDAIRDTEQIRQTMHRRHLRAGIDQHAQLGDCAFYVHCQFSLFYCRCGQSSNGR